MNFTERNTRAKWEVVGGFNNFPLFSFRYILNQLKILNALFTIFIWSRFGAMLHRCYNEQVKTFYFRFQTCSFRSRWLHTHICVWGWLLLLSVFLWRSSSRLLLLVMNSLKFPGITKCSANVPNCPRQGGSLQFGSPSILSDFQSCHLQVLVVYICDYKGSYEWSVCPLGFLIKDTGWNQQWHKCAKAERNERHDDLNTDGLQVGFFLDFYFKKKNKHVCNLQISNNYPTTWKSVSIKKANLKRLCK